MMSKRASFLPVCDSRFFALGKRIAGYSHFSAQSMKEGHHELGFGECSVERCESSSKSIETLRRQKREKGSGRVSRSNPRGRRLESHAGTR